MELRTRDCQKSGFEGVSVGEWCFGLGGGVGIKETGGVLLER